MLSKIVTVVLVILLFHDSIAAQTQPQNRSQPLTKMQQVLHNAQDKQKAVKVTLNRKIDNQSKFTGKVSEISASGFTLSDQRTGKPMRLAYEDVQQVKQKGLSKGAKIGIGVAIGIAALIVVAVAVTKPWQSE